MKTNSDNEIVNDNNDTNDNNSNKDHGIDDQKILEKVLKNERKRYFIYVDPLDDFGAASVARKKCAEAGQYVCVLQ